MHPPDDQAEERTWWTLFPFCGIDLTDKRHDLRRPLFGDVTLVSTRHLPQMIAALELDQEPRHDSASVVQSFETIAQREHVKTFLAVRRKGIVDPFDKSDDDPPIVYQAKERAYEVAALLASCS